MTAREIYDELRRIMTAHGCGKIEGYICDEAPTALIKQKCIAAAVKLGLRDGGYGYGTYRLWLPFPEGSLLAKLNPGMGTEVYLHTRHDPNGYYSAQNSRNLLTLGTYYPASPPK